MLAFKPLIPTFSLKGEGVDTYAQRQKEFFELLEVPISGS
jgi:hypothetical protein